MNELKFSNWKPAHTVVFHNRDGETVGTLWFDGPMRFEGDAEESARVFFEHFLKQLVDDYIESKGGEK